VEVIFTVDKVIITRVTTGGGMLIKKTNKRGKVVIDAEVKHGKLISKEVEK